MHFFKVYVRLDLVVIINNPSYSIDHCRVASSRPMTQLIFLSQNKKQKED